MLWDTAGQEEFDALTKSYYRGAQVFTMLMMVERKRQLATLVSNATTNSYNWLLLFYKSTSLYFQACVFAFSTTDRASLLAVRKWRKKVRWPSYFS